MLKVRSRSHIKRVGCLILLVLLLGIVTPVVRIVWPVFVYPPLLLSLPTPPEYIPESNHFGGAGLDFRGWDRIYDVDQSHEEVVVFFKTKLARRGWKLIAEENSFAFNEYLQTDVAWCKLAFQGPYFFRFNILIEIITQFEEEEQVSLVQVTIRDQP